ncbi:hypothetical protein CY34DRAFT_801227 [Suillus luteus UH-Slu-Lm8-n1]|uniref:Uncharacterized protein n=1 Tax=Suillus luteus UH-Slu-Lm8-n1 TaxID=930992 RepID=A0A0D0AVK7_9AGAM|nr:hypothetical protein CY34DRAFT_801227 [Suillus luteus UH-Slu-Lm8-n1]
MIVGEFRTTFRFDARQNYTFHHSRDSILTKFNSPHQTDNVCRCCEIREPARDLCGYPKIADK